MPRQNTASPGSSGSVSISIGNCASGADGTVVFSQVLKSPPSLYIVKSTLLGKIGWYWSWLLPSYDSEKPGVAIVTSDDAVLWSLS